MLQLSYCTKIFKSL